MDIREAKPEDESELRALQECCPQGATLVVSTVNIPDFFSRVRTYESYKVFVAYEGDRIVGSAAVAIRELLINGAKKHAGYEFQYFTSHDHRGKGIAKKLHSHIEDYLIKQGVVITYGLIMEGNAPSIRVVEGLGFRLHRVLAMQVLMVYKELEVTTGPKIRPVKPGDMPAVANLLNQTWGGCDLYEPVSAEYLERFIDRTQGVSLGNFAVLEEGGEIQACIGFQDWSKVMRITVKAISFRMRAIGLIANLLRVFVPVPGRIKPGDVLNQIMITTIAYKDPVYFSMLLKYINNLALKKGITQMFFVCEPGHVLSKSMKGFTRIASKLYLYLKLLPAAQSGCKPLEKYPSEAVSHGMTLTENGFVEKALHTNTPVFINGIDL